MVFSAPIHAAITNLKILQEQQDEVALAVKDSGLGISLRI